MFEDHGDTGRLLADSPLFSPGDFGYRSAAEPTDLKDLWLFDLSVDELEQHDVSAQHPEVVAEMRAKLAAYQAEAVPPLPDRCAQQCTFWSLLLLIVKY